MIETIKFVLIYAKHFLTSKKPTKFTVSLTDKNKLDTLLNSIDRVVTDSEGSIYIKYKQHVIIECGGHMIQHVPNGVTINQSMFTFNNPVGDKKVQVTDSLSHTLSSVEKSATGVILEALEKNKNTLAYCKENQGELTLADIESLEILHETNKVLKNYIDKESKKCQKK